jgi:hypothetical protein
MKAHAGYTALLPQYFAAFVGGLQLAAYAWHHITCSHWCIL